MPEDLIQGEQEHPVFVKTENTEKDKKKDYSHVYILPSIRTRYFSLLIDFSIIVLVSLVISSWLEKAGEVPGFIRGILFFIVIGLYEPVLVTFGSTIGQSILNIRVRSFNDPEKKLPFLQVFIRFIFKIFLGWLSFITVTFNENRRAIHDFVSGSIMIAEKIEERK